MRKQKWLFVLLPLLALALLFTACPPPNSTDNPDPDPGGDKLTSALPVIKLQPTSVDYVGADPEIATLEVQAMATDGGTLTYQWYETNEDKNSGGTAIDGKTAATCDPDMAGKTESFFYALITNSKGEEFAPQSKASNPARIRILDADAPAPAVTVTINSENKQYVRGFGGMSNGFGIGAPARYMELKDIDTMFHPDTGLGYNILRIMLWPNPLEEVITGQVEPQMGNQITYLEAVKRVNKYGGYVLASPWTPPPEWKVNQSLVGTDPSYLLPQYYGDYAEYLANYARQMARYGAPVYTVALQNEPSWPASYAGCSWTSQQQLDFLTNKNVGKFLTGVPGYGGGQARESVLVMSGEPHQNVTWNDAAKNNNTANGIIDIYGYHIYGSMNGPYLDAQADTDRGRKEVWMTEHNINSQSEPLYPQDSSWNYVWLMAEEVDHVIRVNSSNAFIWWYAKRFYSLIGDNSYGTVNGEVLPRGYVLSHWAKYATDTVRVPAFVTGHPGSGNLSDASTTGKGGTVNVKASAYRRTTTPTTWVERQVKKTDEDSISLVILDQRTGSGAEGQNVRVALPADFGKAKHASAIVSDSSDKRHAPHLVTLVNGGTHADFYLPANGIVSIKFIK